MGVSQACSSLSRWEQCVQAFEVSRQPLAMATGNLRGLQGGRRVEGLGGQARRPLCSPRYRGQQGWGNEFLLTPTGRM